MIEYNIENTSLWKPFFPNKEAIYKFAGESEIYAYQEAEIMYSPPVRNVAELEIRIQNFISSKFQDERIQKAKMNTKWNVRASDRIKDVLHKCEDHKLKVRQGGTNSTLIDPKNSDIGPQG